MCVSWTEGPVEIGMSLDIASIDAISEINMVHLLFLSSAWSNEGAGIFMCFFVSFQDYTATIFLRQRWRDARLMFPGNESVSVDGRLVSLLWIPDTFIPDSKRSFLHDVTVENRLIRIFSNGTVLYALRYISLPKLWRLLTDDISHCWSQTRRKQIQSTPHCSHVLYKKKREKNN